MSKKRAKRKALKRRAAPKVPGVEVPSKPVAEEEKATLWPEKYDPSTWSTLAEEHRGPRPERPATFDLLPALTGRERPTNFQTEKFVYSKVNVERDIYARDVRLTALSQQKTTGAESTVEVTISGMVIESFAGDTSEHILEMLDRESEQNLLDGKFSPGAFASSARDPVMFSARGMISPPPSVRVPPSKDWQREYQQLMSQHEALKTKFDEVKSIWLGTFAAEISAINRLDPELCDGEEMTSEEVIELRTKIEKVLFD